MAKSARASSKKGSRTKLRATVTGPQEEARLQRLSERLLAIASTEKTTMPASTMDVDEDASKQTAEENSSSEKVKGAMDVDGVSAGDSVKKNKRKIIKHSKGKRRASAVFPGLKGSGRGKVQRKRK